MIKCINPLGNETLEVSIVVFMYMYKQHQVPLFAFSITQDGVFPFQNPFPPTYYCVLNAVVIVTVD